MKVNCAESLARITGPILVVCSLIFVLAAPAFAAKSTGAKQLTDKALRYLHGEGVKRNPDRALMYLCNAARKGYGPAAHELGWLYFEGRGVSRSDQLAAAWLREAKRLGEKPPARTMASLSKVKRVKPVCRDANGANIELANVPRAELVEAIYELAPEYDLDPALVLEVVRMESNFNPRARSHKGALGLMQLIPETAARFGVEDPFEPTQNLRGGMAYLRWLLDRFDGDVRLSLAGYNAGEAAVDRYGDVPPYAETQAYVTRILERYTKQRVVNAMI